MSKPTPTPWRVEEEYIWGPKMEMVAELRGTGAGLPKKANAAHIVKCVNMHEQLIAVLKEAYDFLLPFETMAKRIPLNDKIAHLLDEAEAE